MKKLICLLAAAALLVCCALPAFAEASGVSRADYTITAYSVDATLHENNTVTQTERITVDFAVPSRGIYRVLPVALWVEKDTADGPQEMAYRARVRDLAVTGEGQTAGAPVETDTEDGFYSIRIGDEDTWLTGVQTYELTFTYDIGDDRVAAYDELFYSLNGGRWDAPIEDFRFSFTFEKPLTQEQKGALALYSGSYGGKGNEAGVSGAWDGNTFSGAAGRTLYPGEAVTLYARLPRATSPASAWPRYGCFGLLRAQARCWPRTRCCGRCRPGAERRWSRPSVRRQTACPAPRWAISSTIRRMTGTSSR